MYSYDEILKKMKDKFSELAGFDADEASDIGIRLRVLAGEIFSASSYMEWINKQMFPQTATGEQLDMHAQQRGLKRQGNNKAAGTLTFSRNAARGYSVEIPKGTICSTTGLNPIQFKTTSSGSIAEDQTSVNIPAEAVESGLDYNVAANTIKILVSSIEGVTSVINSAAFSGGSDGESDDSLHSRLLESYKNLSTGTNIDFYKKIVMEYDGIRSINIVPTGRGVGTVDIYILKNNGMPSTELINEIQDRINSLRELNVDVKVSGPTSTPVTVSIQVFAKQGYTVNGIKDNCIALIQEFFNSVEIGQTIYPASIANVLFNCEGLLNYHIVTPQSAVNIDANSLAVAGPITISQGSGS